MNPSPASFFFAYPGTPRAIGDSIETAITGLKSHKPKQAFKSWRGLDIGGNEISAEVLDSIAIADVLVADITHLNCNVLFEIGFAIAKQKRAYLVRNSAVEADSLHASLGITDTLGYVEYANSRELISVVNGVVDFHPLPLAPTKNAKAPLYLNLGKKKTEYESKIVSAVKKLRLYFRAFDPNETPRLSAIDAIRDISSSSGALIHFLPPEMADQRTHNLRASFLAGLAYGLELPCLFIQSGADQTPIDYRDLVDVCLHPSQYGELVAQFGPRVVEAMQTIGGVSSKVHLTPLESLNLGASSAENELAYLGDYYLETDAFLRAKRKEVRLVTGRKGSGKTAIFFRLRDEMRSIRGNIVLDLKPDGYQLLKFKDAVLRAMAGGTVEHTLTAFWEYLLLLEICYKILENDQEYHKRDDRLYEPYQRLRALYIGDEYVREGDFAERLSGMLSHITEDFNVKFEGAADVALSAQQLTALLYRHDVSKLRSEVHGYLKYKGELWLLFDNIDKGWPTHGLKADDLVIIRSLMEATRKIERDLLRQKITAHSVVFLRNDVYELLVRETSDRGKETRANVDWTDGDMLREIIRRRIIFSGEIESEPAFEELWRKVVAPYVFSEESSQYLLDRCLMRPRCLIDLINHCKGYAVNLSHVKVQEDDIEKGLRAYSTTLLSEIGLEIEDVFPVYKDVLYAFISCEKLLTAQDVEDILLQYSVVQADVPKVIDLLLWFGFLGVMLDAHQVRYIYDVQYDAKILKAMARKRTDDGVTYQVNPAFWSGLLIGS